MPEGPKPWAESVEPAKFMEQKGSEKPPEAKGEKEKEWKDEFTPAPMLHQKGPEQGSDKV
ncbi:hypothetical protein HZA86_01335 [Candidatus Uhrbacteria bacterium]|nr:hypothetical protein [Candidatus Uhrbacteria bacterium]